MIFVYDMYKEKSILNFRSSSESLILECFYTKIKKRIGWKPCGFRSILNYLYLFEFSSIAFNTICSPNNVPTPIPEPL